MTNFFQAIGIVVALIVIIIVFIGMMYVSYILAIAVLVAGGVAGVYYFLKALKEPAITLDI